jgi:uncharacterized membrane protein
VIRKGEKDVDKVWTFLRDGPPITLNKSQYEFVMRAFIAALVLGVIGLLVWAFS